MTQGISVRDLRKRYKNGLEVLSGVSFDVPPGTIFGYLGRNGAGKSTTVRVLSTLTIPTSGTAHVEGLDVVEHAKEVRRRIGVTMQDAGLDDYATARQHLTLIARLGNMPKPQTHARVGELLDTFGLQDAADRRLGSFSGGMRRRVDIATALLREPRILFLDEPTTGLDPQSRRALWQEIARLRDNGTAILLTTQYLEEAQELADNIGVLDEGRLVAVGTPDGLRREASRTTVTLQSLANESVAELLQLAALAGDARAGASDTVLVELAYPDAADRVTALLARVDSAGIKLRSVRVTEPTLEDAYLRLTGETMTAASSPLAQTTS